MPECTAWVRVRTSTSIRTRPRRLVVRAGTPMSQLPESAITMTSARRSSRFSLQQRGQRLGADLLLALDEEDDVDRQVVAEDPQRGQVGGDAGLVVGGAAAVEAVAALGRLERRAVPVGVVVLGLHVVVGVEQHRRRAVGPLLVRDHRGRPALGAGDPRRAALGLQQRGHGLGAAAYLRGPLGVGAHRLDADQVLEVRAYAGEYLGHLRAQLVGRRGRRHGPTLARAAVVDRESTTTGTHRFCQTMFWLPGPPWVRMSHDQ